jgi:hypothetical protein
MMYVKSIEEAKLNPRYFRVCARFTIRRILDAIVIDSGPNSEAYPLTVDSQWLAERVQSI